MSQTESGFRITALRTVTVACLAGMVFLSLSFVVAPASGGQLDLSFGSRGKVTTNVANNRAARGARFSDFGPVGSGFTVTLRSTERQDALRIVRFGSDGNPDPGYAEAAREQSGVLPLARAQITETLPDGRTIVAGTERGSGGPDVTLRRYTADGTLDRDFGRNGRVRVSFGRSEGPSRLVIGSTGVTLLQVVSSSGGELSTSFPLVLIDRDGRVIERNDQERYYGDIVAADDGTFRATRSTWSDGDEEESALYRIDRTLKITTIRKLDPDNPAWSGPIAMLPGNGFQAFRSRPGFSLEIVRVKPDGTIDGDFTATTCPEPPTGYPVYQSIQVDGEGRTLAGAVGGCALLRTLPDGGLDPSFGTGGIADFPAFDDDPGDSEGGSPFDWSSAVMRDNSIQLLRWDYQAGRLVTARLGANGRPDDSFGQAEITVRQPSFDTARAILKTTRGYVVAGNSRCNLNGPSGGPCQGLGLTAYRKNGRSDRTFGINGKLTESRLTGEALAAVNKRRFLVAGSSNDGKRIALARYTEAGEIDPSFGDNGVATAAVPGRIGDASALAMLVIPDGKILVTGLAYAKRTGFDDYLPVLRFLPDGRLDRHFGDGGIISLRKLGLGTAIARVGRDFVIAARSDDDPVVVRIKPDGRLRRSFGKRGVVTPNLALRSRLKPGTRFMRFRNTSTLKVTGKRILATATDGYGMFGSALFQLRLNGRPDRTFGRNGTAWVGGLSPHALSVDRCRRITVAGTWRRKPNGGRSFGLLRLTGSGAPDRSLANGRLVTPFGRFNGSTARAATAGHPNRTVVAGSRPSELTSSDFALAAVSNPRCHRPGKRTGH